MRWEQGRIVEMNGRAPARPKILDGSAGSGQFVDERDNPL